MSIVQNKNNSHIGRNNRNKTKKGTNFVNGNQKDKVDTKEKDILVMTGYEVVMTGEIFMNRERGHSRM